MIDDSYSRDLRWRTDRCEICGARTWFGAWRCARCALWHDMGLDGHKALYPPLPPLDTPQTQPPATSAQARQTLSGAELRHAAQREAHGERLAWIADWVARWGQTGVAAPSRFELDRRCIVCCDVLNERFSSYAIRPSLAGYRCLTHQRGGAPGRLGEVRA